MIIDLKEFFSTLFLSFGLSSSITSVIWALLSLVVLGLSAAIGVLVLVWLERKISAEVQQRIGPEYAGSFGFLQPLIDGLKLFLKENFFPRNSKQFLYRLGPVIVLLPSFLSFLIIPLSKATLLTDNQSGIFLWLAVASIAPIGLLVSGYAANNKYSFLGALRATSQTISYELPLTFATLALCVIAEGLNVFDIIQSQAKFGILSWNIWRQPIGFATFFLSALAESERLPFDLPEAEEELVAGYQTEYTGITFGLFFVASYVNVLLFSFFITVFYLGGWVPPINKIFFIDQPQLQVLFNVVSIFLTLLKVYSVVFVIILIRWTVPRIRIDQLLNLGWKFLLPLSLGNLFLTATFHFLA
mgnify:CR=1 FL=1